jgi:hypothetical protein
MAERIQKGEMGQAEIGRYTSSASPDSAIRKVSDSIYDAQQGQGFLQTLAKDFLIGVMMY